MPQPKISVIVPVYNAEKTLQRCVDSILAQTFKDFELILVDDGSKDDSLRICMNLSKKDERIRTIHQNNAGPNAARNCGINASRSDFLIFADADDEFYSNNTFELNVEFLLQNPTIDIVSFPQYRENDINKTLVIKKEQFIPQLLKDKRIIFNNWYNGKLIDGHFPGKIFRRTLFEGWHLIENIRFTEDHYNIPDLCQRCRSIQISGMGGYVYKSNPDSAIHTEYTPFKRFGQLKSEIRICQYLTALGNCNKEESGIYLAALENAYYLINTEYAQETFQELQTISRRYRNGHKSLFLKLLSISVSCFGIKSGLKLMGSISKIATSLKKQKTI